MSEINKLRKHLLKIKTESYSYEYDYYNLSEDGSLIPLVMENDRDTFEKFKESNDVGYAGKISLRKITNGDKVIGYVAEKSVNLYDFELKAKETYNEVLDIFIAKYNIQNKDALLFFISEFAEQSLDNGRFYNYLGNIDYLTDIDMRIDEGDKEFEKYFLNFVNCP